MSVFYVSCLWDFALDGLCAGVCTVNSADERGRWVETGERGGVRR